MHQCNSSTTVSSPRSATSTSSTFPISLRLINDSIKPYYLLRLDDQFGREITGALGETPRVAHDNCRQPPHGCKSYFMLSCRT